MNKIWTRDDFRIVRAGKKFYAQYLGSFLFFWKRWKSAFSYTSFDGGDKEFDSLEEAEEAIQESLKNQGTEVVG